MSIRVMSTSITMVKTSCMMVCEMSLMLIWWLASKAETAEMIPTRSCPITVMTACCSCGVVILPPDGDCRASCAPIA